MVVVLEWPKYIHILGAYDEIHGQLDNITLRIV